jgi:hypothetical protein
LRNLRDLWLPLRLWRFFQLGGRLLIKVQMQGGTLKPGAPSPLGPGLLRRYAAASGEAYRVPIRRMGAADGPFSAAAYG